MSRKQQHNNILLAVAAFAAVVIIVGLLGYFFMGNSPEIIQGEVEADSYRVSSKIPSRVVRICVKEGDYVHVGDTLAILEAPEVDAQEKVAQATGDAASAMSELAQKGARKEPIRSAYEVYRQALAARTIAQKTYNRMQTLFDEGVMSEQKRDEAKAAFDVASAQAEAAKSQWRLAQEGARSEEKLAAAKQAQAARQSVNVVKSLLKETVQISPVEGEVSDIYPLEGELVGIGSPIMSIDILKNIWGVFNIREDQLHGMKVGDEITAYSPAFDKKLKLKIYYIKDQGSYAVWKATKSSGQYDVKTLEVKGRPVTKIEGLRPGMTLIIGDGEPAKR